MFSTIYTPTHNWAVKKHPNKILIIIIIPSHRFDVIQQNDLAGTEWADNYVVLRGRARVI